MTWLDWVIVAMTIWFVLQGLIKGGTAALLGALAIIVSYVGSAIASPIIGEPLAQWMARMRLTEMNATEAASWGRMAGFVITFFIAYIVLSILITLFPGGKRPGMGAQIVGVFAGLFKAFVASMAVVGILLASPLWVAMTKDVERSALAGAVADFQRTGIQALRQISPVPFPPVGPDHKF